MLSKVTSRERSASNASGMEAPSLLPRPMSTPTRSAARLAVMSALPPNIGIVPRVWASVSKFMPPPEAPT